MMLYRPIFTLLSMLFFNATLHAMILPDGTDDVIFVRLITPATEFAGGLRLNLTGLEGTLQQLIEPRMLTTTSIRNTVNHIRNFLLALSNLWPSSLNVGNIITLQPTLDVRNITIHPNNFLQTLLADRTFNPLVCTEAELEALMIQHGIRVPRVTMPG
jgi:hypothetical protein